MNKNFFLIPSGGLANRMRAIASAWSLSKATGRNLIIIWQKDKGLNADFEDIFKIDNLPFKIISKPKFLFHFFYELPRKSNLFIPELVHKFDSRKWIYLMGEKVSQYSEETLFDLCLNSNRDIILMGCTTFFPFSNNLLQSLFITKDNIHNRQEEILKNEKPEIAIHIRRTDNKQSILNSPVALFEREIDNEISKNKNIKIFVACDDEDIKRDLKSKYGANIIINPLPARRDTYNGIIDATAELKILSECKKIYGSYYSSFSEMAAMIGNSELLILKNKD